MGERGRAWINHVVTDTDRSTIVLLAATYPCGCLEGEVLLCRAEGECQQMEAMMVCRLLAAGSLGGRSEWVVIVLLNTCAVQLTCGLLTHGAARDAGLLPERPNYASLSFITDAWCGYTCSGKQLGW